MLRLLIERAPAVVSREELREKLWPADTFVDFDHSLNTAINKIREALGDSAASPRFVETLARRGYRFLVQVTWEPSPTVPLASPAPDQPFGSGRPARRRAMTRLLFVLIQIMYLLFYVEALVHWRDVDHISWAVDEGPLLLIVVLVAAAVGIPVRCYLISAIAFDHPLLPDKFRKIFPALLVLDELWAASPFLLVEHIGFGAAFAACAGLVYVPFAERSLVGMSYAPATAISIHG